MEKKAQTNSVTLGPLLRALLHVAPDFKVPDSYGVAGAATNLAAHANQQLKDSWSLKLTGIDPNKVTNTLNQFYTKALSPEQRNTIDTAVHGVFTPGSKANPVKFVPKLLNIAEQNKLTPVIEPALKGDTAGAIAAFKKDGSAVCAKNAQVAPQVPVKSTQAAGQAYTPDQLYRALSAAETGSFKNPWIRTVARNTPKGSTAYGPGQLTNTLAADYANRYPHIFDKQELEYLRRYQEQAKKFNYHGRRKLPTGLEPAVKGYDARYDYGGAGDLGTNPADQKAYQAVTQKIIQQIYQDKAKGDVNSFVKAWRGRPEQQDPEYYRQFRKALSTAKPVNQVTTTPAKPVSPPTTTQIKSPSKPVASATAAPIKKQAMQPFVTPTTPATTMPNTVQPKPATPPASVFNDLKGTSKSPAGASINQGIAYAPAPKGLVQANMGPDYTKPPYQQHTEVHTASADDDPVVLQFIGPGKEVKAEVITEIADTWSKRRQGLSNRLCLPNGYGMLFDKVGSYWMKDVNFPLDIVFLDKQGVVLEKQRMDTVEKSASNLPTNTLNLPTYSPLTNEAAVALELPAGWFDKKGLSVGDRVRPVELKFASLKR